MKNLIKTSLFLIIASLFFSCDQENDSFIEDQNNILNDIQLITYHGDNKSANNGYSMLYFKDMNTFRQTITNLEMEAEQHDDAYIAAYPKLSGEDLTENEFKVGFDHYKVFKDFTKRYNFKNSMINAYIDEETKWLSNKFLDISKDPAIKFLESEPEEMSVLNEDGVVQINDTIYIQASNGYVTIPNNNIEGLYTYLNNFDFSGIGPISISWADLGYDFSSFSNWFDNLPSPTYNCSSDDTNTGWWNYSSTRKIKGVVKSHSGQWWGGIYLKSKTVYYRRYWFFGYHWIQTRSAGLTAALDGTFAGNTCGDMYNHLYENVDYTHNTNKYRVIHKLPSDFAFDITNNEMKGIHKKGSFRKEHYLR